MLQASRESKWQKKSYNNIVGSDPEYVTAPLQPADSSGWLREHLPAPKEDKGSQSTSAAQVVEPGAHHSNSLDSVRRDQDMRLVEVCDDEAPTARILV